MAGDQAIAPQVPLGVFASRLTDEEAAAVQKLGRVAQARRGQAVVSEGQVPGCVLLIQRGTAKEVAASRTRGEVLLALRGAGELIGEVALFDRRPRSATVVALDALEFRVIAESDFRVFLEQNPGVAQAVFATISERLREAGRNQLAFAAADTLGRVAARLLELAERFGEPTEEGIRVALPVTQEEIAGWASASLEATARALRQMRELGWIETGRKVLIIRDADALQDRAA